MSPLNQSEVCDIMLDPAIVFQPSSDVSLSSLTTSTFSDEQMYEKRFREGYNVQYGLWVKENHALVIECRLHEDTHQQICLNCVSGNHSEIFKCPEAKVASTAK